MTVVLIIKFLCLTIFLYGWKALDSQKNKSSIFNQQIIISKTILTIGITIVVYYLLIYYSREFMDFFLGWCLLTSVLIIEQLLCYLGFLLKSLYKKKILLESLIKFFFYITNITACLVLFAIITKTYGNFFFALYLIFYGILIILMGFQQVLNFFEKHDFLKNFFLLMLYWSNLLCLLVLLEFLRNF